jgi:hypothetical protein
MSLSPRLHKEDRAFDLGTEDLIKLKNAEVSDAASDTMMDPKATPAAPSAEPTYQIPVITSPINACHDNSEPFRRNACPRSQFVWRSQRPDGAA